jgi:hypothetical protein
MGVLFSETANAPKAQSPGMNGHVFVERTPVSQELRMKGSGKRAFLHMQEPVGAA